MFKFLITCFVLQFVCANGAKILGIVPTPSYSHQIPFQAIWRELSLRGHQVTVLTTDPMKDPKLTNLTEIDVHYIYKDWNKEAEHFASGKYSNPLVIMDMYYKLVTHLADLQLQHPKMQELINNKNQHFDLVIVEFIHPVMFAFGERYKCPMIGMITVGAANYFLRELGNPIHPALDTDGFLPYVGELTFFQRLHRILFDALYPTFVNTYIPAMQEVVKKHFGNDFPHLSKITKSVDILFTNTDNVLGFVKPLLPTIIQVGGGIHIKPPKPLPQDLKQILDNANKGFIYFSLGSNVKSKDLSNKVKSSILETFSEIPYKVLWKFEQENLPNKPENVIISKWYPQQAVLRHPNIKLFISQVGYQSMEEALYSKVPMLGIPFIGDQEYNANTITHKGFGLRIDDSTDFTKNELKSKILELIRNPKYKNKVEELAKLAADQPMTGLERAVWWSEYVIRHKGAKHLRSPARDLPFYQYYLLDVIGFCLTIIILGIYVIVKTIGVSVKICKYFFAKKTKFE